MFLSSTYLFSKYLLSAWYCGVEGSRGLALLGPNLVGETDIKQIYIHTHTHQLHTVIGALQRKCSVFSERRGVWASSGLGGRGKVCL